MEKDWSFDLERSKATASRKLGVIKNYEFYSQYSCQQFWNVLLTLVQKKSRPVGLMIRTLRQITEYFYNISDFFPI